MAAARDWLLAQTATVQQPWDSKGFKIPGGGVNTPAVQQLFMVANAKLRERTYGNYPAPANIMSCLFEGLITDLDTGLKTEARYFVNCVLSPEAKNMIRTLFFSLGEANKLAARPKDVAKQAYTQVGILGAGMMGAGIAYVTAKAGIRAVLLDTTQETAERGRNHAKKLVDMQVARGLMAQDRADSLMAQIITTTDYAQLAASELVIEAVFEDRNIKADVTRSAEAVLNTSALFSSNTSTLPISGLAQASSRPEQFIGLHFFSPVEKMPLIEVIMGQKTSQATIARALDYVNAVGMTPIVVNDSRGFYTSRCFATYLFEGLAMLAEGVTPALIENAGLQSGMPVGPLALTDEVSAELCVKIDRQTQSDLSAAYHAPVGIAVAQKLVALGRIGKKAGKGFYDHAEGGKKALWPGLAEQFPVAGQQPTLQALMQRLITIQSVESARCLAEGVVTTARDADVGSVLGWGVPPFRGGTIGHIHNTGVAAFVALCDALATLHGERFTPPQSLRDMAARGETFYSR